MKKTDTALAKALHNENKKLRSIIKELSHYSRRYCDYRQSYATYKYNATSKYNDLVRLCLSMDIELDTTDGIIWARDLMGRAYDHLSDQEAIEDTAEALGRLSRFDRHGEDEGC